MLIVVFDLQQNGWKCEVYMYLKRHDDGRYLNVHVPFTEDSDNVELASSEYFGNDFVGLSHSKNGNNIVITNQ